MNRILPIGKARMSAALGAALLMFVASSLRGQKASDTAIQTLPEGVKILADASPKTATVGDPIRIDFDIHVPKGYQVEVPKPVAKETDFSIFDFFPGPQLPESNKSQNSVRSFSPQAGEIIQHRARVIVAIYKTGKFTFPSIPIKLKTADGKEVAAASPPVSIEIRSVLTEKNPSLRDLKKQSEIPETTRWLMWGIAALAVSLLCAISWYIWRRRKRKPAPLTPVQKQDLLAQAEMELHNLLQQGFPAKGREKQFYVLLSDIVKRILSAGFAIHTAEQTTSEIVASLYRSSVQKPEDRKNIESFLIRCDVVKFAKYIPSQDEHKGASDEAFRILAAAKEKQYHCLPAQESTNNIGPERIQ